MSSDRHIVCTKCASVNRIPAARQALDARCGKCHERLFDGHPADVDAALFDRLLERNSLPVLVDVFVRRHARQPRRRVGHRERGGQQREQPDVLERALAGGGVGAWRGRRHDTRRRPARELAPASREARAGGVAPADVNGAG